MSGANEQDNEIPYVVGLRSRRVIIGRIKGSPLGVHPVDRLLIKRLCSERVHKELPTRVKCRHCDGKGEGRRRLKE